MSQGLCLDSYQDGYFTVMIVLGLVLLLLGALLNIQIFWTLGIVLLVIGVVLMLLGSTGRQIGGRSHYW